MLKDLPYEVVNKVPMTRWKPLSNANTYLVHTETEFEAFFELLMKQRRFAADTETSGFDYFKEDRIVGTSFGWNDLNFYIPHRHEDSVQGGEIGRQLDMDFARPYYQEVFGDKSKIAILWNNKFDRHFYKADGVDFRCEVHDAMFLWALHNSAAPKALKDVMNGWTDNMKLWNPGLVGSGANKYEKLVSKWRGDEAKARRSALSAKVMSMADDLQTSPEYQHLKRVPLKKHIKEVLLKDHPLQNSKKEDVHYGYVPLDIMVPYAGLDTHFTNIGFDYVLDHYDLSGRRADLYQAELDLSEALFQTEEKGNRISREYCQDQADQLKQAEEALERTIRGPEYFNDPIINLGSTDQVTAALIEQGVNLTEKTDKGKYKLDSKILKKISKKHPVASMIVDLRKLSKLRSTYFESMISKATDDDIIHGSFNQIVETGRMSSHSPNLQNMPRAGVEVITVDGAKKIIGDVRGAFRVRSPDHIYVFVDYSQIEVRLTAHFSRDPVLVNAYLAGKDVHISSAANMFNIPYDHMFDVLKVQGKAHKDYAWFKALRNVGKTINFSIVYGSGAKGLSEQIPRPVEYAGLSEKQWVNQCQEFIDKYFYSHIGVKRFTIDAGSRTAKHGLIENPFGRVRHLPHAHARKIWTKRNPKHKLSPEELEENMSYLQWLEGKAKRQGCNFLVQGTAGDVFKIATSRVHRILSATPKQRSFICNLVHDDIQFQLHKEDIHLLPQIRDAMEDFPQFIVPLKVDVEYSTTSWGDKKEL